MKMQPAAALQLNVVSILNSAAHLWVHPQAHPSIPVWPFPPFITIPVLSDLPPLFHHPPNVEQCSWCDHQRHWFSPSVEMQRKGFRLAFTLDFKCTLKIKWPFVNGRGKLLLSGPKFPSGDTTGGHEGIQKCGSQVQKLLLLDKKRGYLRFSWLQELLLCYGLDILIKHLSVWLWWGRFPQQLQLLLIFSHVSSSSPKHYEKLPRS